MSGQPLNGVMRYSPIVCIPCTSILMPQVAPYRAPEAPCKNRRSILFLPWMLGQRPCICLCILISEYALQMYACS